MLKFKVGDKVRITCSNVKDIDWSKYTGLEGVVVEVFPENDHAYSVHIPINNRDFCWSENELELIKKDGIEEIVTTKYKINGNDTIFDTREDALKFKAEEGLVIKKRQATDELSKVTNNWNIADYIVRHREEIRKLLDF